MSDCAAPGRPGGRGGGRSHQGRRTEPAARPRRAQSVYRPLQRFFHDILHTQYRAATDVYALMFLADVVDFIIIIFGFWAFGVSTEPGGTPRPPTRSHPLTSALPTQKHSAATDITSSLSDDQVPEAFLVMLLIQFSTMVVDRALYLRKTVLGKLAFQVALVLAIHVWMFFVLPAVTERWACGRARGPRGCGPGRPPDPALPFPAGCSARTRWPNCGTS